MKYSNSTPNESVVRRRVFVRNKSEDYTLTGPVRSISYIYHVKEQFKVGYFVLTFISVTAIYW